jgi:hypothetical protein
VVGITAYKYYKRRASLFNWRDVCQFQTVRRPLHVPQNAVWGVIFHLLWCVSGCL